MNLRPCLRPRPRDESISCSWPRVLPANPPPCEAAAGAEITPTEPAAGALSWRGYFQRVGRRNHPHRRECFRPAGRDTCDGRAGRRPHSGVVAVLKFFDRGLDVSPCLRYYSIRQTKKRNRTCLCPTPLYRNRRVVVPSLEGCRFPEIHSIRFTSTRELLARTSDVAEVNNSFYQALKPEIVRLWMRKVELNPRFQFTAKLHQQFTHHRILDNGEIAAFKEGLWPLLRARKLGALLMQFPWAFRFTAENHREFLIRLRRAFHEFPLVAEMRHAATGWPRKPSARSSITGSAFAISISPSTRAPCLPRHI